MAGLSDHRRRRDDAEIHRILVATHFLRHWGTRIAGAYIALLTVSVIAIWVLQVRTLATETHLRDANLRICHRLNVVRAGDNVSHYVEWNALRHYRVVISLSKELSWIPLTPSCVVAVDHASTFRSPNPIRFSTSLPTAKDLHVGPGE